MRTRYDHFLHFVRQQLPDTSLVVPNLRYAPLLDAELSFFASALLQHMAKPLLDRTAAAITETLGLEDTTAPYIGASLNMLLSVATSVAVRRLRPVVTREAYKQSAIFREVWLASQVLEEKIKAPYRNAFDPQKRHAQAINWYDTYEYAFLAWGMVSAHGLNGIFNSLSLPPLQSRALLIGTSVFVQEYIHHRFGVGMNIFPLVQLLGYLQGGGIGTVAIQESKNIKLWQSSADKEFYFVQDEDLIASVNSSDRSYLHFEPFTSKPSTGNVVSFSDKWRCFDPAICRKLLFTQTNPKLEGTLGIYFNKQSKEYYSGISLDEVVAFAKQMLAEVLEVTSTRLAPVPDIVLPEQFRDYHDVILSPRAELLQQMEEFWSYQTADLSPFTLRVAGEFLRMGHPGSNHFEKVLGEAASNLYLQFIDGRNGARIAQVTSENFKLDMQRYAAQPLITPQFFLDIFKKKHTVAVSSDVSFMQPLVREGKLEAEGLHAIHVCIQDEKLPVDAELLKATLAIQKHLHHFLQTCRLPHLPKLPAKLMPRILEAIYPGLKENDYQVIWTALIGGEKRIEGKQPEPTVAVAEEGKVGTHVERLLLSVIKGAKEVKANKTTGDVPLFTSYVNQVERGRTDMQTVDMQSPHQSRLRRRIAVQDTGAGLGAA